MLCPIKLVFSLAPISSIATSKEFIPRQSYDVSSYDKARIAMYAYRSFTDSLCKKYPYIERRELEHVLHHAYDNAICHGRMTYFEVIVTEDNAKKEIIIQIFNNFPEDSVFPPELEGKVFTPKTKSFEVPEEHRDTKWGRIGRGVKVITRFIPELLSKKYNFNSDPYIRWIRISENGKKGIVFEIHLPIFKLNSEVGSEAVSL